MGRPPACPFHPVGRPSGARGLDFETTTGKSSEIAAAWGTSVIAPRLAVNEY